MDFKDQVRNLVGDTKLPVTVGKDKVIGYMQLLTAEDAEDPALVKKFTQWRSRYKEVFFTVFEPTETRTTNWLKNHVVGNPNKFFFKVLNKDSELIGHVGAIYNSTDNYIEYDNLVIGEEEKIPGFIYFVELNFVNWLLAHFKTGYILSRVLSTNSRVVTLHEKTGFMLHHKIPFKKINTGPGEFQWLVDEGDHEPEAYCVDLRLYPAVNH